MARKTFPSSLSRPIRYVMHYNRKIVQSVEAALRPTVAGGGDLDFAQAVFEVSVVVEMGIKPACIMSRPRFGMTDVKAVGHQARPEKRPDPAIQIR